MAMEKSCARIVKAHRPTIGDRMTTWIVLMVALGFALGLLTVAVWILVGWTPADAQPSDRLDRLRDVVKR